MPINKPPLFPGDSTPWLGSTRSQAPAPGARKRLAEHHDRIENLKTEVEHHKRPVARLDEELERINRKIASFDPANTARSIADVARSDAALSDVLTADANDLAVAQLKKQSIEAALVECRTELDHAQAELSSAMAVLDDYVIAVLEEGHVDLLRRREEARLAFIKVDAEVSALTKTLFETGEAGQYGGAYHMSWLKAGERVAAAVFEKALRPESTPKMIADAKHLWGVIIDQLRQRA